MQFNNEKTRNVAEIAAKIMSGQHPVEEELKGGQKKIDKNHNGKIDGQDFAILRGQKKANEETEQIDEDMMGYKIRQKHEDKWRVHSPSGEHVGDVTKHENGYRYHGGHATKWDGTEKSSHYKTGIVSSKSEAAKKVASIHKSSLSENVENLDEDMMGYKARQKHDDKWRIHSPEGEHIGDVTRHENGWQYHAGHHSKWNGSEDSPHYKTGVEKTRAAASRKVASIHKASLDENVEQIDELSKKTLHGYVKKSFSDKEKGNLDTPQRQKGLRRATSRLYKEEESLDEVKMADLPSTKVQGRAYGASKPEPHAVDVLKGPKDTELKKIEAEKKKKNFSEMINTYKEDGLKSFLESLDKKEEEIIDELSKDIADYTMDVIDAGDYAEVTIGEEATEDEFNNEMKKAQAKSEGKDKAEVAKGSVQAVKQESTEITDEMIFEVLENAGIDFEKLNDDELQEVAQEAYEILQGLSEDAEQIDEILARHMTEPEIKKKEDIAKSMKKGMAGFKDRYGSRAKNVLYATATKRAMEK
jgi:mRNA-degrading endonuclease RelE of RelBE toxin-antitoxin system